MPTPCAKPSYAKGPIEDVSPFLDHSALAVTTTYLRRLGGQEDRTWGAGCGSDVPMTGRLRSRNDSSDLCTAGGHEVPGGLEQQSAQPGRSNRRSLNGLNRCDVQRTATSLPQRVVNADQ